ncbi:sulfite exporter TauE/SafE family protein [Pectobacterium actinidiae]|uniref:sulfite exporter TauE/SafE family protein n=1 Tax=Pectobacterium actinidiae TaxID=1507808 RepID=UPI0037FB3201
MTIGGILGFLIGALLGLTGAGGGILAVPALIFGLGMDMRQAAPVALIAVGMAAVVGALQGLRRGTVRYKAAAVLAVTGAMASPMGAAMAHRLPDLWLNLVFAAIMLVVAYRMFESSRRTLLAGQAINTTPRVCKVDSETGRFKWNLRTLAMLGLIGVVSGVCTGMLGVGGGFIIVPALEYFSELRMHNIVSTSLMVIALISAATVSLALNQGMALTAPAWAFSLAAAAGMGAGRVLAMHIPAVALQRGFSVVCIIVAAVMVIRTFG